MLDSIRRRIAHASFDPWAVDAVLNETTSETEELPADGTVLLTQRAGPGSNDVDLKDYYKKLVVTAMAHDGWFQGYRMSIPWLRMTLAGLEMRPIPAELMWEGVNESTSPVTSVYRDLFPAENDPMV